MWDDNAIEKTWLEVIFNGNDALGGSNTNTGLTSSYVFFFGNAIGESGNAPTTSFQVTAADEISARNDPHGIGNPATKSNNNDFNRDGLVNSADQAIARNNNTSLGNQLKLLIVGGGGPFAPQTTGDAAVPAGTDTEPASFPQYSTTIAKTNLFARVRAGGTCQGSTNQTLTPI